MRFLQLWIEQLWYESGVDTKKNKRRQVLLALFYPLSLLYKKLVEKLRQDYLSGKKSSTAIDCPVIVVGNITVGGTGKTPLVIWLVEQLQQHGYKPGIVSRGYGGRAHTFPLLVNQGCDPALVGDEPAMMARRLNAPVLIDPDRVRGASYLSEALGCNIIVSDDGLQHYNLKRDIEIAVVDGKRGLGNGLCLPGGPLREPAQRLETVDFVVINSATNTGVAETGAVPGLSQKLVAQSMQMSILPGKMFSLQDKASVVSDPAKDLKQPVHALAGIGNPSRFFATLESMGLSFHAHAFPDHYRYQASDINFADELDIVMTEKDAIKCQSFASSRCFYLAVNAQMGAEFWPRLQAKISEVLK
ncbi:MAG TPA: tetraacyldisaccharide 4'-kinase [Pseudomonadales bacterium]